MIVIFKMPGTRPDIIMLKHQVLNRAMRSRVDTQGGERGGELVRMWWGSERVGNTDRELRLQWTI